MKKPLIIIDMQYGFQAERLTPVIKGVRKEIELAKKQDRPIIIVEYIDHEDTIGEIYQEIRDYKQVSHVYKDADSAYWYLAKFWRYDVPKVVRLCGINASCCVKDTLNDLREYYPEMFIEVPIRACGDQYSGQRINEVPRLRHPTKKVKFLKHSGVKLWNNGQ